MKKLSFIILALFLLIGRGYAQQHTSERSFTRNAQPSQIKFENREKREITAPATNYQNAEAAATQKIMDRDVVLSASNMEIWECLDATSSQDRFTTVSKKEWKQNDYTIDSVEYTLYRSDMTVDRTIKIRTDTMLTNDVRIQPEYTRLMFNTGSSDREFVVFIHYWKDEINPANQNYKHFIIKEDGEVMHEYDDTDALMLYYNSAATAANQRRFIVSKYVNYEGHIPNNQDTATFVVYQIPNTRVPAVMATHRIGQKNLVGFNGPMFGLKVNGANAYYYFPHYEKPYYIGSPADGQTTTDNKGVITLYNFTNGSVYKNFELPMPNWSNAMQVSFGIWFNEYDFTTGIFDTDNKMDLMYGAAAYVSSCDCHQYKYYVVNEDGAIVKSMDRLVSGNNTAIKLADIPGQPTQYAMLEAANSAISMFEPESWTWGASFQPTHQGEVITSSINRIPEGDDYVYIMGMYDVLEEGGNRYSVVNFYDKNADKIRSSKLNMGPLGGFTEMVFTESTLNPYVINDDGKREYLALANTYINNSDTYLNSIYIFSESGEMIYRADDHDVPEASDAKLSGAQGYWSLDGGKNQHYFILSYSNGKTYFFKLPFGSLEGEGTAENPYLISDAGHLDAIRKNPSAHYKIVNDIDMSTLLNIKYGAGWTAIPTFSGKLDGQNFAIKNLKLVSSENTLALFTLLKNNAEIKNLRIEEGNLVVNGHSKVGFIAGDTDPGANISIKNVHVSGSITGMGTSTTLGGIIADPQGVNGGAADEGPKIDQCSFDGVINVTANSQFGIGAIVGRTRNNASVTNSVSKGSITISGGTGGVGGVVGQMGSTSLVKNCYSTANITANSHVGGVVGYFNEQSNSKGTIENGYSTGRIKATGAANANAAGGVVGYSSDNNAHINVNFSTWEVTVVKTKLTMGGLLALNDSVTTSTSNHAVAKRLVGLNTSANGNIADFGTPTADSLKNCYASSNMIVGNQTTTGTVTSNDADSFDGADITTTTLTKNFLTDIGWKFGSDAQNPWVWVNDGYPVLWFEVAATSVAIDPNELTLAMDSTHLLVATVYPDHALNKNVSWISSDESIVSVNNGLITGLTVGTATITVTTEDGGYTSSCVVNVIAEEANLIAITVNGNDMEIENGIFELHYAANCSEENITLQINAVGTPIITAGGTSYTTGSVIPLSVDKTAIVIKITASASTLSYTLTVSKALGSAATPMYVQRWGKTLAVVNNPANNGGHVFNEYKWYHNGILQDNDHGYILLNNRPATEYAAEVNSTKTGVWHKLCPNVKSQVQSEIVAYPNPVGAGQLLNLNLPEGTDKVSVRIYDMSGNLIRQQNGVHSAVTAPNQAGVYVIRIELPDGNVAIQNILVE